MDEMPADVDLVVCGQVPLSGGGFGPGRVYIADGRIAAVAEGADREGAGGEGKRGPARVIDAGAAFILPGAVDAHVHSYSHAGEGLLASTSAAAAGGVTTIVEMPFDATGPINSVGRLAAKQQRIADEAIVDVALLGTLEPGGGWRRTDDLVSRGVVGFKVSLFDTDPFRFPRISDAELLPVMRAVGEAGSTLCAHAENNEIIKALLAEQGGHDPIDPGAHAATRPPVSETLGALTAMEIAAHQGNSLHLCHLSLGRSAELAGWYREQGVDVSFETCPHYLLFTEREVFAHKGRLKINPPLRAPVEREAMWDAVTGGLATVISSDHAPWPAQLKDHERILDNHSGVPGVQTLVAATLGECLRRYGAGKEFETTLAALTKNPAERYGLAHKGSLAHGYDADIMVLTPDPDFRITADGQYSNAGWTPYEGYAPGARVSMTISRGAVVWSADAGLSATPGRGAQVVRR
jgi:allantoinase